jgi:NADH-quinone oxidoreductase subunit M
VFHHDWWASAIAMIGVIYASVYMLRLYQSSMNGPQRGADARRVELRGRDLIVLLPLIGVMALLALWPQAILGGSSASVNTVVAPAQVAIGRPANEIHALVLPNPLPTPGIQGAPGQ